ncbi:MAG: RlmE family RNA methyltransferase [Alphaproteobacteria bacterium]
MKKVTHQKITSRKEIKASSRAWLQRQINDVYVQSRAKDGWRCRAAYKFLEINSKYRLVRPGLVMVDLGAAPGGWSQVMAKLSGKTANPEAKGCIVGIDLLDIAPMPGVIFLQGDFTIPAMQQQLQEVVKNHAVANEQGRMIDLVVSDMAANTTGHRDTDYLRTQYLADLALDFALNQLKQGGAFVTKIFQGGGEAEFQKTLKACFTKVHNVKPPASRAESREMYVVATGFRGYSAPDIES